MRMGDGDEDKEGEVECKSSSRKEAFHSGQQNDLVEPLQSKKPSVHRGGGHPTL